MKRQAAHHVGEDEKPVDNSCALAAKPKSVLRKEQQNSIHLAFIN